VRGFFAENTVLGRIDLVFCACAREPLPVSFTKTGYFTLFFA
jgi:hypothetical protein